MKNKKLTFAENCLKYGVGAFNIDACRVGHNEDLSVIREGNKKLDTNQQGWGFKSVSRGNEGRFPTNFILSHTADCELLGFEDDTRSGGERTTTCHSGKETISGGEGTGGTMKETSQVAKWNCSPQCPCKLLDEQSGVTKSNLKLTEAGIGAGCIAKYDGRKKMPEATKKEKVIRTYAGEGGASRFFKQIESEDTDILP